MSLVYLGIGTNLGDKESNIKNAVLCLGIEVGEVLCVSSFYASKPWGFASKNEFLNAVVLLETELLPFDLMAKTQQIEKQLGRTEKISEGYSDRLMDIDILLYDNLIINEPTLQIPHPHITERNFVYVPLTELTPDLVHPLLGIKISELMNR